MKSKARRHLPSEVLRGDQKGPVGSSKHKRFNLFIDYNWPRIKSHRSEARIKEKELKRTEEPRTSRAERKEGKGGNDPDRVITPANHLYDYDLIDMKEN
jgi:hypothetical protein